MLALWRGELSDEQSHAIQRHFTVCPTCASRSDRFRNVADSSVSNQGAVTVSISPLPATPSQRSAALAHPALRAAESLPRIPRQLGPYRLISLLGRGGMGMVFKASHTRLKRLAAVKVLPPSLIEDAYQADRLHREIEAAGAVRHPNVVFATDAGEDQGIVYLVMEYVAGIDLGRLIAQHGPLAVADACEITRQAAEGLAHLHHRHLIHRDLKPTNLMLASDGTVKILDLGLARFLTARQGDKELTDREDVLGTADYMAPEQAASPREVDARSDIYSLGCTLFKLLIGRAPFSDDEHTSFGAKILAHQQSAPPQLASLRKDVPAGLATVVEQMLAKSQDARLQTADEVGQALEPWCAGANLVPLVPESLAETQDLSPEDMPWLARTPSPAGASPHSGSPAAPVLQSSPTRFPPWAKWLAIAGGLAAVLLIAGAVFIRTLEPEPEFREISWPGGGRGRHGFQYDPIRGTLHTYSEQRQYIRVGSYAGQTGKLGVTIDQVDVGWPGDAGIFLGYREVPFRGEYAARAQIFRLARMDIQMGKSPPRLMVCREVMTLEPTSGGREDKVEYFAPIPWPDRQPIRLEIELADGRVTGILANGQRLDALIAPEVNDAMPPVETVGQAGVFNRGPAGTWFSELSFELLPP